MFDGTQDVKTWIIPAYSTSTISSVRFPFSSFVSRTFPSFDSHLHDRPKTQGFSSSSNDSDKEYASVLKKDIRQMAAKLGEYANAMEVIAWKVLRREKKKQSLRL